MVTTVDDTAVRISQAKLAEHFNVTDRTVRNWVGMGMPCHPKPASLRGDFEFVLEECAPWVERHTLEAFEARKKRLARQIAERGIKRSAPGRRKRGRPRKGAK